jgi:hypothetical protein
MASFHKSRHGVIRALRLRNLNRTPKATFLAHDDNEGVRPEAALSVRAFTSRISFERRHPPNVTERAF